MIRESLCLLLILVSTLATIPLDLQSTSESSRLVLEAPALSIPDPNGTNDAFNVTFAHFDLYTRINTTDPLATPPGNLTWSGKFTNSTGSSIPDTAFRYQLPANTTQVQEINYTLNIPRGVASNTFIAFKWNGTLGKGTNATYQLYNVTLIPWASVTKQGNQTFAGGPPVNATGGHPFSCTVTEECLDVSSFIGFNLTLRFAFKSNSTGGGVDVRVTNVIVASVQTSFTRATSHTMALKPSNQVEHRGNLTLAYNATVTYPKPNTGLNITHTWRQMVTTFFLPSSYNFGTISQNGTQIYPGPVAMGQGPCTRPLCTNSTFLSLNMTQNVSRTSTVEVIAMSPNAVTNLEPMLGGISTNFWTPGDTVSVRMTSHPGFNVSGSQTVNFTDPNRFTTVRGQPVSNKGGSYVYNLTLPASATLGLWNITGAFLSGYDFGFLARSFRVEQINTGPLTMIGEAGQGKTLTVQGTLTYGSNSSAAGGVNATVFAVDMGSPPGPVYSTGTPSSPGLYISNITLTNGAFSENQPLIVLFTVVNPALSTAFSADLTIQHEWYFGPGGSHGTSVTFPLTLGDEPFTLSPSSTYRMDVSLTFNGVQVSVKSLTRTSGTVTRTLTSDSSAVSPSRQHFGLFNIAVTSRPFAGGSSNTNSLRSPTYAYLMTNSSVTPSRLLDSSPTVVTGLTNGSFTATLKADKLLGAKRLVLFVLARDVNGVVTGLGQVKTVSDSTVLTPTANIPTEVTIRQSVTVTLSLTSNSTTLPVTLTVNVDVSGSTAFGTKTVTIQPGSTVPVDFPLTAPDAAGSYLLTFSSPQYGVILTKELKVGLLQSSLQVLIPAIIGLVSALVILGLYLIRKRGATEIVEEEKKRPSPGKPSKPTQAPGSKSLTRS